MRKVMNWVSFGVGIVEPPLLFVPLLISNLNLPALCVVQATLMVFWWGCYSPFMWREIQRGKLPPSGEALFTVTFDIRRVQS